MGPVANLAFSHVGLFVHDLARMEDFYRRVIGLTVTDRGMLGGAQQLVFLSRDAREHHQIVLVSGRPQELAFNVLNQLSFRVGSLGELREFHRALCAEAAVSEIRPVTHGNAWSVYFRDPEGNRLEVFCDTPWYVAQPLREPLDLGLGDQEICARTEALCRTLPGFKPVREWQEELAARLHAAQAARACGAVRSSE